VCDCNQGETGQAGEATVTEVSSYIHNSECQTLSKHPMLHTTHCLMSH